MTLRQKLKAQTDEVVQLQSKLSTLSNQHKQEKDTLVTEVHELSGQVATLSTSLQHAESSTQGHSTQLEELRSGHATELDGIQSRLAETELKLKQAADGGSALEKARAELETAKKRVEELELEAKAAKEESKTLRESVSVAEKTAGESKRQIDELVKRVDDLEGENKTANAKIAELEKSAEKPAEKGSKKDVKKVEKQLEALRLEVEEERTKREEGEKEHEDLLVLLEELSQKRKADKARMREKGLDVSEGEDEDDDEE